ncbi:ThuA domain-containing protein [Pontibacter sp. 172403-2]|uniref:PVC-type heme-binding CxxCH protein n=1 Tax=Pontibacter rufus TaxID=2791028 RepID=UPI0018AF7F42|nr:PVC-type heme-binding CxxCH protein [Pontibacter sp. 172403-2]MBF9252833.1 ThuA domain-containing protein [Pontibacter sp. 172403-2]
MRRLLYALILSFPILSQCAQKTHSEQSAGTSLPPKRIEILFLGHNSKHHDSEKLAPMLAIPLFQRGINLTYTENPGDLNQENLSKYDGVIIYANHDTIAPGQEQALKAFVEGGKGLIPIHCASFCFRNSDWYVNTVGGQFLRHDTATFTAQIVKPDHPVMQGVSEFEAWDETYVHSKINPDMTVLMERVEGEHHEPWTWVRTQGKGRVFYTASGHDERSWGNPEFQKLIGNGILWAVSDEAKEQLAKLNVPTLTYVEAKVPNYEKRDPAPKFQNPLDAAASQKLIQVPAGFELQLFASEPDIVNPIAMSWDEKGRLWVIETVDYPNSVRDQEGVGDDRIKILEDTNGDGKADKFTVFADSLNIPTSLVFANGGVIVSQAPVFLFLKDTDGDDKADVRQTIIEGWGVSDTHAGPSNLKYGLDNKIWGTVGYSSFEGKVGGKEMSFGQGLYRFSPDGKNLEYLARTSNNTWGLGFNENFDIFLSTANNTHSAYYYMPDSYIKRVLAGGDAQGIKKIDGHYAMHTMTPNLRQVDVHGGFTAAAGHNLYTARSFPQEYWNRIAFVCEPTGRVVHQAILEPDGAGYKEQDDWNLMASSDEWMGPVQAEVGPDGAVWVADWYDFIIQHNPTPTPDRGGYQAETGKGNAYINPLRDHQRGRIYRIIYKGAKPYTPVQLDRNKPETLVNALKNDNMFWRTTAQRLLVESGNTAVVPALYEIVNNQQVDEIGLNAPAVHALWTMQGLGALSGANPEALQVAVKALSHPAAGVRKTAIQVLPKNEQTLGAMLKLGLLQDANLVTRLAALLAVAEMPASDDAGKALYQASLDTANEKDPALAQALFVAAAKHQHGFKQAMQSGAVPLQSESGAASLTQRISQSLEKDIRMLERWVGIPALSAPDVAGKEITIRGTVNKRGDNVVDGVLVAHGDNKNGYALYAGEGKLYMLVKQHGKASTISAPQPQAEAFNVVAQLKQGGKMVLQIDGQTVAQGKAAGLFQEQVPYDIRVGTDRKGDMKVGPYKDDSGLNGGFSKSFIEVSADNSNQAGSAVAEADVTVNIKVIKEQMKFNKESFTVKAGQMVELVLENPDFMQHNWVLGKIGTMEKVGAAADKLARDPKGAEKNYVPRIPEVLAATELVNPESSTIIRFRAPDKVGDYPYVCTFPGHWRIMNGVMKVVK